ncbi:EPF-type Cis2-His2 zinc finger transcription factor [Selaginella moellendorffii]|uniref:EPF-type Cis2-His2 zinc finger transcription factor n=1 Tax=Selaginella moellendorffii TaxID=88036 RepID=D8SPM9_SELML|nr:EPF-type Cis2-His2 zinc finger transcription factor [Selaginella moellendorffii]
MATQQDFAAAAPPPPSFLKSWQQRVEELGLLAMADRTGNRRNIGGFSQDISDDRGKSEVAAAATAWNGNDQVEQRHARISARDCRLDLGLGRFLDEVRGRDRIRGILGGSMIDGGGGVMHPTNPRDSPPRSHPKRSRSLGLVEESKSEEQLDPPAPDRYANLPRPPPAIKKEEDRPSQELGGSSPPFACLECRKRFPSGKALSGHMRCHRRFPMILGQGGESSDSSGSSSPRALDRDHKIATAAAASSWIDKAKNPKRKIDAIDQEEGPESSDSIEATYVAAAMAMAAATTITGEAAAASGPVIPPGNKKIMTGRRSGRRSLRQKNRWRTHVLAAPADIKDEKDMANCLVMLAGGGGGGAGDTETIRRASSCASVAADDHHRRARSPLDPKLLADLDDQGGEEVDWVRAKSSSCRTTATSAASATAPGRYSCATCKRVFKSHQALGGHRASHKKVKGCFAIKTSSSSSSKATTTLTTLDDDCYDPDEENRYHPYEKQYRDSSLSNRSLAGGHECSICHRVFATGQALGGHKRCHWVGASNNSNNPGTATPPPAADSNQVLRVSASTTTTDNDSPMVLVATAGDNCDRDRRPDHSRRSSRHLELDLNLPPPPEDGQGSERGARTETTRSCDSSSFGLIA